MKDATTNSDICDLYTEGSHHRNLSVICLLQNMYYKGKETRTMSLNTHYMVLFKNPRDQQQISCLARQMYPTKAHHFLQTYEKATAHPHGCLVVDLKQNTPENQRLKFDVFKNGINTYDKVEDDQSDKECHYKEPFKQEALPYTVGQNGLPYVDLLNPFVDMSAPSKHIVPTCHCIDCGQVFATPLDLKYHVDKDLCTGSNDDSDMETNAGSDSEDISENATYQHILNEAREENEAKWQKIVDKNIENGMDEDDAKVKADTKMLEADKSLFKSKLVDFFVLLNGIRHSKLMRDILNEYDSYGNMSEKKAMKKAIQKHMDQFEDLFEEDNDTNRDSEEDSDMESEYDANDSSEGGMQTSRTNGYLEPGERVNIHAKRAEALLKQNNQSTNRLGLHPYQPDVERWKRYFSGDKN